MNHERITYLPKLQQHLNSHTMMVVNSTFKNELIFIRELLDHLRILAVKKLQMSL